MLRLAVIGDECLHREYAMTARRLRGITRMDFGDLSCSDVLECHPDEFDAAVLDHTMTGDPMEMACQLVAAGKHLILESALIRSVDEVEGIIRAQQDTSSQVMIGGSLRFRPDVQAVHQSLAAGKLGRAGFLRVHQWRSAINAISDVQRDLIAVIDLACWLFQAQPLVVFAQRLIKPAEAPHSAAAESVHVHLGFPDNGMALLDVSQASHLTAGYTAINLIGSTGAAYADDHRNMQITLHHQGIRAEGTSDVDNARLTQLAQFADAVTSGCVPPCSLADYHIALQIEARVTESIETGEAVQVESEPS